VQHVGEVPEWSKKDVNSFYDLNWMGRIAKNADPIKPCNTFYFNYCLVFLDS
jgi:hypothetical protein